MGPREYFWKFRNQNSEVQSDVGVTRGQVDKENNNKVEIQTYQIINMNRVLYTKLGDRALFRDIKNVRGNTARQCIHD